MREPQHISSAANALIKDLRRLSQDSSAYRKQGRVWLEGDHLCRAALTRGKLPQLAVFSESAWSASGRDWSLHTGQTVVVADRLFDSLSGLESPAQIGFVIALPGQPALQPTAASIVLDGVQDAGNVGSILRSAAAFGFSQVLAMKGTAALWSPKVLRSAMGAHFALELIEAVEPEQVAQLQSPLLATSSHQGDLLHQAALPWPCAWILGHEGQGVGRELAALSPRWVRIIQPGGEESLNVASAAAICMHASAASGQNS